MFSEYIIDCKNYNEKPGYCTWHESTLRSWLNGYSANENRNGIDYSKSGFFNKAFSEKEKILIVNKEITIMSNESGTQKVLAGYEREAVKRDYGITHYGFPKPDYNVFKKLFDDKVILLTAEELYNTEYGFKSIDKIEGFDTAKTAYHTEYAVANQANISSENEGNNLGSDWFVSSFLEEESFLSPPPGFAISDGFITDYYDEYNLFYLRGIRPATWVENKDYARKKVSKENSIKYANLYSGRLVCFGRYPQKEVSRYGNLFDELYSQDWKEKDEIDYKGYKYRRVKRPAEKKSLPESVKSFKWGEHEYAFFSYSPIVWRVLQADEDGVLLISERVLDHKKLEKNHGKSRKSEIG